jgi:type VI secretion system protein VasD
MSYTRLTTKMNRRATSVTGASGVRPNLRSSAVVESVRSSAVIRSLTAVAALCSFAGVAAAQFLPVPAATPAPAPVPAQPPGVTFQVPGVPMAPTVTVPVPGMPQAAPAPAAPAPAAVAPKPGAVPPQPVAVAPPPAPPKPSIAELSFVIDANVNPDAKGRPSPVVVRIYELKSLAAFNRADFFSLYEKDRELLAADLVNRDELPMIPGAKPQAITTLRSDTRYLGVVAAFRDIEGARWRASTPIFVNQTTRMEIKLDRNEVAIRLQ